MTTGHIPPPEMLEHYAAIQPDYPERLMRMAEQEQSRRLDRADTAQSQLARQATFGQVCGLAVALTGLVVAGWLGTHGSQIAAAIIGSVDLVSLTAVFLRSTQRSDQPPKPKTTNGPGPK